MSIVGREHGESIKAILKYIVEQRHPLLDNMGTCEGNRRQFNRGNRRNQPMVWDTKFIQMFTEFFPKIGINEI